jgi:hypothetical protein
LNNFDCMRDVVGTKSDDTLDNCLGVRERHGARVLGVKSDRVRKRTCPGQGIPTVVSGERDYPQRLHTFRQKVQEGSRFHGIVEYRRK